MFFLCLPFVLNAQPERARTSLGGEFGGTVLTPSMLSESISGQYRLFFRHGLIKNIEGELNIGLGFLSVASQQNRFFSIEYRGVLPVKSPFPGFSDDRFSPYLFAGVGLLPFKKVKSSPVNDPLLRESDEIPGSLLKLNGNGLLMQIPMGVGTDIKLDRSNELKVTAGYHLMVNSISGTDLGGPGFLGLTVGVKVRTASKTLKISNEPGASSTVSTTNRSVSDSRSRDSVLSLETTQNDLEIDATSNFNDRTDFPYVNFSNFYFESMEYESFQEAIYQVRIGTFKNKERADRHAEEAANLLNRETVIDVGTVTGLYRVYLVPTDQVEKTIYDLKSARNLYHDAFLEVKKNPEAYTFQLLRRMASLLKSHEDLRAEIRGYADPAGDDSFNSALSFIRSWQIMKYFLEQEVPPSKLTASGYGEKAPVERQQFTAAYPTSRRVEVRLLEKRKVTDCRKDTVSILSESYEKRNWSEETLTIRFNSYSNQLSRQSKQALAALAKYLNSHSDQIIRITGFANDSDNGEVNRILQNARAATVVKFLLCQGISYDSIDITNTHKEDEGTGKRVKLSIKKTDS